MTSNVMNVFFRNALLASPLPNLWQSDYAQTFAWVHEMIEAEYDPLRIPYFQARSVEEIEILCVVSH
ncbi:MAG: hypothetical protein JW384_02151 [Nitrosomonadaceae bacterium]|nr:hypothetical protein [Nitrosomonadaceae bacterium]